MFYDICALLVLLLFLSLPISAYIIDRWGFNKVAHPDDSIVD